MKPEEIHCIVLIFICSSGDEQQFHIFFFFNHINAVSLIFFRRTDGCSIEQEQHFPFFIFSSVNKKCSFRLRIPIREGVYSPQFGSGIAKVQM